MTLRGVASTLIITACLALLNSPSATAGDWPTYLNDIARGGSSDEAPAGLVLQWKRTPRHAPEAAWGLVAKDNKGGHVQRDRVDFDDAYQVTVAGSTLYFASSGDGKIYALDTRSGQERWSFLTDGPARLAPTIANGRVYCGSDDGHVYCLDADDGALIWKHQVGPRDERVIGSGRMISRWPVRTNVMVDDGIAYFCAGVFPHETVFIAAANADTGKLLWINDTLSQRDAGRNEVSPQGYLLASKTQLFVPSGRALPAAFDRATGAFQHNARHAWRGTSARGVVGGTYALLADDQIYTGSHDLIALDQATGSAGFGWFPGRRLVIVDNMAYLATGKEVMAVERLDYAKASGPHTLAQIKLSKARSTAYKAASAATASDAKFVTAQRALAALGANPTSEAKAALARAQSDSEKKDAALTKAEEAVVKAQETFKTFATEVMEPTITWRVPSMCDTALIRAGEMLFAGGQDLAVGIDTKSGKQTWSAKVSGRTRGLAVADRRLFVTTDTGEILCFGAKNQRPEKSIVDAQKTSRSPYADDHLTSLYQSAARRIIEKTDARRGFCLIVGAEEGRLAYELAKLTDLRIYGVEPDAGKVAKARRALDAAGLHGNRVVIEQGELASLPYSNFFANLIVSDTTLLTGKPVGLSSNVARHLKPCGGEVCLVAQANTPNAGQPLGLWIRSMNFGDARVEAGSQFAIASLERGPLPGAGAWTHQYGEPGNTACGDDEIVGGDLGLLWYGEPGPAPMADRHAAAAAPLAVGGLLFTQGLDVVMAYDQYNGVKMWERKLPGATRLHLKKEECGNLAADGDSLYIALPDRCVRLNQSTGETRNEYPLPKSSDGKERKWGYLSCVDGQVFGSTMTDEGESDSLFAVEVESGRQLWRRDGAHIVHLTIAVGDDKIFFVDSSISKEQREALLAQEKEELRKLTGKEAKEAEAQLKRMDARMAVALDTKSGKPKWERAIDVTDCSRIGIGGGELTAMYSDEALVFCGANANGHYWSQFLKGEFSQRRLVALDGDTGDVKWERDANYRHRPVIVEKGIVAEPWSYDLDTGEQVTRVNPITGEETPWLFLRPGHHCGAISANKNMLFFRSLSTAYYDLNADNGTRHFAGQRMGCWINAIPAGGLTIIPEASAGCVCLFPITCSVALEPKASSRAWGLYSAIGKTVPATRLGVNFGAPGDRTDADGKLWLSHPRPNMGKTSALGLKLGITQEVAEGGGYFDLNNDTVTVTGARTPWLLTSGCRGMTRCEIPLADPKAKPVMYTIRLHFADFENSKAGRRVFDLKLQGKPILTGFDVAKEAGGARKAIVREIKGVIVQDSLVIEMESKGKGAHDASRGAILNAIEAIAEQDAVGIAKAQ